MESQKRFFFSCIILLLSLSIYGQDYTPFYLDNAKWTMELVSPVLGSGDGHAYWEIFTQDDTLIGEKVYRKIALRNLCEQWPNAEGNLQYNTSINTNEFLLGGLREESQKVYFVRFDQEPAWRLLQGKTNRFNPGEEYLLYDFNRSPGDTVHFSDLSYYTVTNGDTSYFTSSHYTIIDEELSASQDHRRYEIRSSSAFAFPFETGSWIEGIGSSYGLLGS